MIRKSDSTELQQNLHSANTQMPTDPQVYGDYALLKKKKLLYSYSLICNLYRKLFKCLFKNIY